MVDIGNKRATHRIALAAGDIAMRPETLSLIRLGGHKKGDVLGVARIAGIMGCKKTAELVPLCHSLPLSSVSIEFEICDEPSCVRCRARAETHSRTGVEMEALVAVQVALLTIYDMCKAVDRGMTINNIRLIRKSGGRSGEWERTEPPLKKGHVVG